MDRRAVLKGPLLNWLLILTIALSGSLAIGIVVVNVSASREVGVEAERSLLIAEMQTAVQSESEAAASFITHPPGDEDMMTDHPSDGVAMHDSMHSEGPDASDPLADHPEILAAADKFRKAAASARALSSDEQSESLDEALAAHIAYMVSLEHLNDAVHTESDAMQVYHTDTQVAETVLRDRVHQLRTEAIEELTAAVDRTDWSGRLLTIVLPIAAGGGLLAAVWLARTRNTRRRIEFLEQVVAEKDRFIGTVSHELRTPLSAIVGFAELLSSSESDVADSEKRDYLSLILAQGNEVTAIVEDLLVAARAEIGELTMVEVPVNLAAQTHQVIEALDISIEVPDESLCAKADPVRVRQIVRNLLTNAIRYGGPVIEVQIEESHDSAVLRVLDDGDAVPETEWERMFEPYATLDGGRPVTGSIGLGLAVSRQLARMMGGDLGYAHENGKSVFALTLPLAASGARAGWRAETLVGLS